MSKCELAIVFDRADRTFRGGETVSGTVIVRTEEEVVCNGLQLVSRWETHGRGNADYGSPQERNLFAGRWQAGETYRYPFSVVAPAGPPTYHGHYLNVDHYVRVRADVPWAVDPKAQEEFIVLPGPGDYGCRPNLAQADRAARGNPAVTSIVGLIMIVAGIVLAAKFFCLMAILIPIGVFLLAVTLRRTLAERKTGQVTLRCAPVEIAPGEVVQLHVSLTPRKKLAVNRATARLQAREECVHGSGTDRTTHKHVLHEAVIPLAPKGEHAAGEPIDWTVELPLPAGAHYSFSAEDNKLIWEVEVTIDIAGWPDWRETRTLCVRPAAGVPQTPVSTTAPPTRTPPPAAPVPPVPPVPPVQAAIAPLPAPAVEASAEEPAQAPSPAAGPTASLGDLFAAIAATGRYSSEREQVVDRYGGQSFPCEIEIERIERTYAFDVDERLRHGRTIIGRLAGTTHKLALVAEATHNDELDALQPGQLVRARGLPVKWNVIHERLEMWEG